MCLRDRDGAHIKTLLLTFFFRHMPELIERGHVLIAQPPLYKVKRGKSERYIKDENEMTNHIVALSLQDSSLTTHNGTTLEGDALRELTERYYGVMDHIQRLERVFPPEVVEQLLYIPMFDVEAMSNRDAVAQWTAMLEERVSSFSDSHAQYHIDIVEDSERHLFYPEVTVVNHGVRRQYVLTADFFSSQDYAKFAIFGNEINELVAEGSSVGKGEKSHSVDSLKSALLWLESEALRGQTRQRYKGLGEMNPDQLWETTMDPQVRSMLRVSIEDAIAADQMFTTLMGEKVEPRKDFIVNNALSVVNLDV